MVMRQDGWAIDPPGLRHQDRNDALHIYNMQINLAILKIALVVLGSLLLAGCDSRYYVSRANTSDQQTAQDMYDCRQRSMKFSYGPNTGSTDPDWETYKLCLEGRGYTVKTGSQVRAESRSCANNYSATQGKQLFQSKGLCFGCHGMNGDGKYTNPKAAELNPPPTDLTRPDKLKYPGDEARYSVIRNGIAGTGMVPFRDRLTDLEIRRIIEYLEIIKARGC